MPDYGSENEPTNNLGLGLFLRSLSGNNPNADWIQYAPSVDGQMQVSSARNAAMTPPNCPTFQKAFFHNGYVKSLKELVHFYNTRDVFAYPVQSGHCPAGTIEKVTSKCCDDILRMPATSGTKAAKPTPALSPAGRLTAWYLERAAASFATFANFSRAPSVAARAFTAASASYCCRRMGLKICLDALPTLLIAFALGTVMALALMLLDRWVFAPIPSVAELVHNAESAGAKPTAWQGFLASFYGAVDEEILMRLPLPCGPAWSAYRDTADIAPRRWTALNRCF